MSMAEWLVVRCLANFDQIVRLEVAEKRYIEGEARARVEYLALHENLRNLSVKPTASATGKKFSSAVQLLPILALFIALSFKENKSHL